jgi:hypothetical protein
MATVRLAAVRGTAPASSRALLPAGALVACFQDPEPRLGEHGGDPVGPHPVLGDVAEVDVGRRRQAAAGETRPGTAAGSPRSIVGSAVTSAVGDRGGQPLERGRAARAATRARRRTSPASPRRRSTACTGSRPRPSRRSPRPRSAPAGMRSNFARGQPSAGVELLLLRLVDPHRDRQDPDIPVVVALVDAARDGGRAVDGLVAQREAVHQDVGQVTVQISAMSDRPVRLSISV